ncbi:MAG: SPOR domain-containing protein, partial [Nitrospinaceae bacterium]|nr:SPOR domain-containing protein [Nitrospinaceae bacterium]
YTIQVGAYKTQNNASKIANQLSDKGYDVFVTQYSKDGATLFKVHVEKFSDKEKAYQLANTLSNKEKLPNFVTTINPG